MRFAMAVVIIGGVFTGLPSNASNVFRVKRRSQLQVSKFADEIKSRPSAITSYVDKRKIDKIGTFGATMAGAEWREKMVTSYAKLIEQFRGGKSTVQGLSPMEEAKHLIYDPRKENWSPKDAVEEAKHLSKDSVIVFGLLKDYASVGSMGEIGFLALQSVMKGRKTFVIAQNADGSLADNVKRARSMSIIDAKRLSQAAPRTFRFVDSFDKAAELSFEEKLAHGAVIASPITEEFTKKLVPRKDVLPRVVVSGTSNEPGVKARGEVMSVLKKAKVKGVDTVRPDWSLDVYENEELPLKDKALVNMVLVTNPESYGAIKDIGMAAFRAITTGTYAVIYAPHSPNKAHKDYERALALVNAHWQHISKEYPWANHYVKFASSPTEAAELAALIVNNHPKKVRDQRPASPVLTTRQVK